MLTGGHPALRAGFLGVTALHLLAQVFSISLLQVSTKPLLMPLLAAWFLTATPTSRGRTIVAVGLVWSWLGDVGLMPSGQAWFLAGLGAFLVAQLCYAAAFWPDRAHSVLARPVLLLPYLGVLVGLPAVLWEELGSLRLPVVLYAVAIIAMAVLATGVSRVVALGAALFVISDALIAVNTLGGLLRLPAHGFWVMATYLAAQALIAWGMSRRLSADRSPPA